MARVHCGRKDGLMRRVVRCSGHMQTCTIFQARTDANRSLHIDIEAGSAVVVRLVADLPCPTVAGAARDWHNRMVGYSGLLCDRDGTPARGRESVEWAVLPPPLRALLTAAGCAW